MTQLYTGDPSHNEGASYKVDVSRGQRIGRVSSEWFSRPSRPRAGRTERSRTRTVRGR